jgi:4-amino-4-deoxy-L-arabinose transferase-like glycosyltransferase
MLPPVSEFAPSGDSRGMTFAKHHVSSVEVDDAPAWRIRLAVLWSNPWFGAAFLFLASMLIYLPGANRVPHVDELYHILAAYGVLAEGVPRIADGLYTRAELFTRLVAGSMALFGDHPLSARLPSLLAGGVLVVAVFLWTRAVAGNLAAWIAAGFLCLAPASAQLFLWVRFYALFALAFWLGAVGAYALATRPWSWPRDAVLAAGCVVAFALAWHLQPLTLIGLVGIGVWLAVAIVLPWLWRHLATPSRRWGFLAAGTALAAVAGLVVLSVGSEPLQALWQKYRWSPLHSIEHQNAVWYYHLVMLKDYPTLWSVVPLISLLALAVRPQPALFCTTVFVVILALLSFAGMKDPRYLFFALPFLFVPWGIALASGLTAAGRWVVAVNQSFRGFFSMCVTRSPACSHTRAKSSGS